MDLEDYSVSAYLRSHPEFLQDWLERNADLVLLEAVKQKWDENNREKSQFESLEVPKASEGYVIVFN